jgi:hypothetical protein
MCVDPLHFFAADLDRLIASGAADTALPAWQNLAPNLTRFATVSALAFELDRAERDVDYDTADTLLHALLLVAGSGGNASRIAATLVAARMVPGAGPVVGQLLSATRTCGRHLSVADARLTVAGCLWERVRSYPLTRTARVAGNLRAELLRHALIAEDVHPRCTGRATPVDPTVLTDLLPEVEGGQQASEELVRVLAWAVGEHVLSRTQSDLLLARWAQGTYPVATRVLGERMGMPQRTVAHRCARAEQLLADAVRTAEAA